MSSPGKVRPEPLVLHVAEGECVEVHLTNHRGGDRVSFNVTKVLRDTESSGINTGYNPEQTIAPGDVARVPLLRRHPEARRSPRERLRW